MSTRIPLSRAEEEARLRRERLDLSIAEMGLSVRTTNCLEETGILTVRDLLNATPRGCCRSATLARKHWKRFTQRWKNWVSTGRAVKAWRHNDVAWAATSSLLICEP